MTPLQAQLIKTLALAGAKLNPLFDAKKFEHDCLIALATKATAA